MVQHRKLAQLKAQQATHRALATALLLEEIVPWDLTLGECVLTCKDDGFTKHKLLQLQHQFGEAALTRFARLFSRCDHDRDAVLKSEEIFAAVSALQVEFRGHEAALPSSIATADSHTLGAMHNFNQLCDERLHEFTLLRLLSPPARPSVGRARREQGREDGVMDVAAAAIAAARGGRAAQQEAAVQAVQDAVAAERARIEAESNSGADGLGLTQFLDKALLLRDELAVAQAGVFGTAEAARRAAAAAARSAAEETKNVEHVEKALESGSFEAIFEVAGRLGDDSSHDGADVGAVHRLLRHTMPLPGDIGAAPAVPSSAITETGSSPAKNSEFPVSLESLWRPHVQVTYLEEVRQRRNIGVTTCLEHMDPVGETGVPHHGATHGAMHQGRTW